MGFWKNIIPGSIYAPLNTWRRDYLGESYKSFSGEGEDLILRKMFAGKKKGFYVDVGAYHPKVYSNSHYFYQIGWHGINIDADPLSIEKFNKFRKRDINLNVGIAEKESILPYYMFDESAINTFSHDLYLQRIAENKTRFNKKVDVRTVSLASVLDTHLHGKEIDFLDIDVEGFDLIVLKSNNWNKYRPKVILVEDQNTAAVPLHESETYQFLANLDYSLIAKTFNTFIFKHK